MRKNGIIKSNGFLLVFVKDNETLYMEIKKKVPNRCFLLS